MFLLNLCDFRYLFHIFKWVMYLKKTLEMIGLTVLICFSFILTEKTSTIMKDNDEIMTSLKENRETFEYASIDAKILNDEIIPGISGKVVDIEESYQAMKKVGSYKTNLMVYKTILPEVSLTDNYDKYVVSGNRSKKQITLIFKIDNNQKIDDIVALLNKNKMQANFFVSSDWASSNINKIKDMSGSGYNFGKLKYDDNNDLFKSIIKINTKQINHYCYSEEKNTKLLESCSKNKEYTILPSIVINDNLLATLMKNIQSGSIISISINKNTSKELATTLDYIKSKGYRVVNLDNLLTE